MGRLDTETEGVILLTNHGELAHRLTHPKYGVKKTYLAAIVGPIPRDLGKKLKDGIQLEDGYARADHFRVVEQTGKNYLVEVTLHEGRKRSVRRMLARGRLPGRQAGAGRLRPDHPRRPEVGLAAAAVEHRGRHADRGSRPVPGSTSRDRSTSRACDLPAPPFIVGDDSGGRVMQGYDKYAYEPFAVTVDLAVLTLRGGALHVLLVERQQGAVRRDGRALPGGFVLPDESAETAARRELAKGNRLEDVSGLHLEQLRTYSEPDRDPRMRGSSPSPSPRCCPTRPNRTAAATRPRPAALYDDARPLAFDHDRILADAHERVSTSSSTPASRPPSARPSSPWASSSRSTRRCGARDWTGPTTAARCSPPRASSSPSRRRRAADRQQQSEPAALYRAGPATSLHPPLLRPPREGRRGPLTATTTVRKRAATGALVGLALGDALGFPTEFNDVPSILAKCGPWREMQLPERAFVSDDTQMTLAVGRALRTAMDRGLLVPSRLERPLREEFIDWYRLPREQPGPGRTLPDRLQPAEGREALLAGRQPDRLQGLRRQHARRPLGLAPGLSDEQRAGAAQLQSALTHGHPTALAASDLTAHAVRLLAQGAEPAGLVGQGSPSYALEHRSRYHERWLGDLWTRSQDPRPGALHRARLGRVSGRSGPPPGGTARPVARDRPVPGHGGGVDRRGGPGNRAALLPALPRRAGDRPAPGRLLVRRLRLHRLPGGRLRGRVRRGRGVAHGRGRTGSSTRGSW
ncbi:hypothetical protein SHIRM173S_08911 [Streptomyces hirsutus]